MRTQLHLTEGALADGLAKQVATDPISLLVRWLSHQINIMTAKHNKNVSTNNKSTHVSYSHTICPLSFKKAMISMISVYLPINSSCLLNGSLLCYEFERYQPHRLRN